MSIPAHKPSEPAEVTDLSALFEFAEEATLDQAAPASAASQAEPPVAPTAGQPRGTRAARTDVDTADAVAADRDRRDDPQGKSNLEEILGGDLPLEALEPPPPTDVYPAEVDSPFIDEEAAEHGEVLASAAGQGQAAVDQSDPPAQNAAVAAATPQQEAEPVGQPGGPELRLALEEPAFTGPSAPALDLPDLDATDGFDSGGAESFDSGEPEVPAPVETLTVADLLALGVELSWQEAVSVLLEWLQAWNDPDHCPDPSAAALREGGRVELLSDGHVSGPAVPAAAMLLTDLLGPAKTPPQLRSMIENDRVMPTEHADLAQFTSALSYFGRPNRRVDLAAVHTRLHESRRRLVAEHELSRLRARVVAVPRQKALPRWLTAVVDRAQESPLTFVLWLLVGMNSLAFLWLAMSSRTTEAPAPPAMVTATSAPAAVASVAEVTDPEPARPAAPTPAPASRGPRSEATQSPPARIVPSSPAPTVAAAPAPLRTASPRAGTGTAGAQSGTRAAGPQVATSPAENGGPRPVSSIPTTTAPAARVEAPNPPRATGAAPVRTATPERPSTVERRPVRRSDDGRLYSSGDADVIPPRLLRPSLRTPELESSFGGEGAEFELVIGPTGRVERVRLLKPSERLEDKMLLAAAKAWEFDPAVRDGVPVWYRLTVKIP